MVVEISVVIGKVVGKAVVGSVVGTEVVTLVVGTAVEIPKVVTTSVVGS